MIDSLVDILLSVFVVFGFDSKNNNNNKITKILTNGLIVADSPFGPGGPEFKKKSSHTGGPGGPGGPGTYAPAIPSPRSPLSPEKNKTIMLTSKISTLNITNDKPF
ncbi:hypothetical protein DERP_003861 [Dermatophagoides pteronyssinus]|uniref:Uncharacterized protein n=1 Tax=Dermatophagoides pteronyssinus TaxID=6956 RepID=A0ABQ8J7J4_DERPT|nr:hypothetical protein DERP_003861 [Dermatophagoides pteronyssinus]